MFSLALTTIALLIGAWALIVGLGVLLLPVYLWVRHRDAMAELDEQLERRYGPLPR